MILLTLFTISYQECSQNNFGDYILQKNIINNNCSFDIIRINRLDVLCNDYGVNKKYCNHFSLPNEFIVIKELGVNSKENIIIKPYAMWITDDKFYKKKIADFHYTYKCSSNNNIPVLIINIIPRKEFDKSFKQEIFEFIFIICLLVFIILIFELICPCLLHNDDNFYSGYTIGSFNSKYHSERIYCE